MARRLIFIPILLLGTVLLHTAFADDGVEQEKISYLLNVIGTSDAVFIRNGVEYPGSEARKHLEEKLHAAGGAIRTADDFIKYIASHSYLTGKPYYVRLPDGTQLEAEVWLREQLSHWKPKQ